MPPTLADRVRHILEAIEEIERALAGKSLQEFSADGFSAPASNGCWRSCARHCGISPTT
jgi:hypothetical protein